MVTDIQSKSIMNAVSQSSSLHIKLLDDLLDMVISSNREEDSLGRTGDSDEYFDFYMNIALPLLIKSLSTLEATQVPVLTQKKPSQVGIG